MGREMRLDLARWRHGALGGPPNVQLRGDKKQVALGTWLSLTKRPLHSLPGDVGHFIVPGRRTHDVLGEVFASQEQFIRLCRSFGGAGERLRKGR